MAIYANKSLLTRVFEEGPANSLAGSAGKPCYGTLVRMKEVRKHRNMAARGSVGGGPAQQKLDDVELAIAYGKCQRRSTKPVGCID